MAAVLAVSSYPHRTSPVLRGKWVMETLLGTSPPPPPPDVPPLDDNHEDLEARTGRERLEIHRRNPACAGCHSRMDQLGFALENYDVTGHWRTEDAGKPVDAKGELPDGAAFNGPEELKRLLMERKDQVIRNLASKMLGYALSRGLTLEDQCAVDQIVEQVKKNEYSAHTLVQAIALSIPFRFAPPPPPTAPAPVKKDNRNPKK